LLRLLQTYHVSYIGDLSIYLSPLFTSDDRVIIAPYDPHSTQMQKGKEPEAAGVPYQPISLTGMSLTNLGLLAGFFEPEPTLANALAAFRPYGNALEMHRNLWD